MDAVKQKQDEQLMAHKAVADLLARAERTELLAAYEHLDVKPQAQPVRGPETGLVMVRGRIGGGGAAFNLGEVTVSRASIRLASGTIGHAHALGTDREKVRLAAIFDALWLEADTRSFVEAHVLQGVRKRLSEKDQKNAEETAATRVDFFTMVRGED